MKPFLLNRPISMVRAPHGINSINFYQKHPQESFPNYIERVKLRENKGGSGVYITIDELDDVLFLVNLGVLEFHTTLSTTKDFEHPDQIVFDFDPAPDAPWEYVIDGCLEIRTLLKKEGMKPKLKTTGGKGFHVYADVVKKRAWKDAKVYAKAMAQILVDKNPEKYTLQLLKKNRVGKVFIDYLRNERGATAICSYSTRARAGAPISKPIGWSEIDKVKPNQFTVTDYI